MRITRPEHIGQDAVERNAERASAPDRATELRCTIGQRRAVCACHAADQAATQTTPSSRTTASSATALHEY
eukprot:1061645-Heterocapsa_arctica.AAC.1